MEKLQTEDDMDHPAEESGGKMTLDVPPEQADLMRDNEDGGLLGETTSPSHTSSNQKPDRSDMPIELQLEEVDMNDPDMDAFEWGARKLIPIPKKYYWETGNYDLPFKTKAWHRIVGTGAAAVRFIDRIGQPVTEATGLTSSRFSYVTDTMTERQWAKAKKTASSRKLQHDARRESKAVEEGEHMG